MSVFLEYQYRDTAMHRLNPITKLVFTLSLVVLTGLYWDIRLLVPLAVIGLMLALVARVPRMWFMAIIGVWIALIPFTLIGILTQVNPELFKVYPRELVAQEFITVNVPLLGKIGVTWGGLLWGLAFQAKIPIILLFVYSFIYSTSFSDTVNALGRYNIPYQLLFVLMISYRFVPVIVRQTMTIITALKMRGWEVRSRNPKVLFRSILPLAYSLIRSVVKMVDEVNMAARIRAFGAARFTPVRQIEMTAKDRAIRAITLAGMAVALTLLFWMNIGMI